jgi:hypothetical protein
MCHWKQPKTYLKISNINITTVGIPEGGATLSALNIRTSNGNIFEKRANLIRSLGKM